MTVDEATDHAVADASIALAWVLPGEGFDVALRLRSQAIERPLVLLCPPTFWYEVANALWVAIRRGRLTYDDAHRALNALQDFEFEPHDVYAASCLSLSAEYGLAVYDAAYVVLAMDSRAPLWSLDGQTADVARAVGVTVLPDPKG